MVHESAGRQLLLVSDGSLATRDHNHHEASIEQSLDPILGPCAVLLLPLWPSTSDGGSSPHRGVHAFDLQLARL